MTRETFNEGFAALLAAYKYAQEHFTPETQKVYWELLQKIPDDKFNAGVRRVMATSKFFPTIAKIGGACIPPIKRPAPYNPYVYTPPRVLDWQEQIEEIERAQQKQIDRKTKALLEGIGDSK